MRGGNNEKMKKGIIIALGFCSIMTWGCKTGVPIGSKTEKNIPVETAFDKVYDATQEALKESKNAKFDLKGIDLAFATTTTVSAEGEVKAFVLSGKYTGEKSFSKKATFSFAEDETHGLTKSSDANITAFKKYLVGVLKSSMEVNQKGNFKLQEIEVEVEFTVKNSISGGVEIEISPVTLGGTVGREKEIVHTITLKFKKK